MRQAKYSNVFMLCLAIAVSCFWGCVRHQAEAREADVKFKDERHYAPHVFLAAIEAIDLESITVRLERTFSGASLPDSSKLYFIHFDSDILMGGLARESIRPGERLVFFVYQEEGASNPKYYIKSISSPEYFSSIIIK